MAEPLLQSTLFIWYATDHLRIIQVRQNFNLSLGDNLKLPQKSIFGWGYTAEFFTVYALVVELTLVKILAL